MKFANLVPRPFLVLSYMSMRDFPASKLYREAKDLCNGKDGILQEGKLEGQKDKARFLKDVFMLQLKWFIKSKPSSYNN